jgi:hypothetical protein
MKEKDPALFIVIASSVLSRSDHAASPSSTCSHYASSVMLSTPATEIQPVGDKDQALFITITSSVLSRPACAASTLSTCSNHAHSALVSTPVTKFRPARKKDPVLFIIITSSLLSPRSINFIHLITSHSVQSCQLSSRIHLFRPVGEKSSTFYNNIIISVKLLRPSSIAFVLPRIPFLGSLKV